MTLLLPKVKSFGEEFGEKLGGGLGEGFSQKMQQRNDEKTFEKLGIPKEVAKLPKEMQAEFFKNAFAQNKPISPLDQTKIDLNKEKLKFLQGQDSPKFEDEGEVQETPEGAEEPTESNTVNKPSKKAKNGLIDEKEIQKAAMLYPSLANQMQRHNDNILKDQRHQEDLVYQKSKDKQKYDFDVHKESTKYDEELLHNSSTAKKQDQALETIEKALKSGNVKPTSWANIFKGRGEIGNKISNALLNGDQAAFLTAIPHLLEGWKQVFGVRLTDADLALLEDKLPSIGKNAEANRAVIGVLKKAASQSKLKQQIASDIKEKNGGLRPLGYADQVEKRFDDMTKLVPMRSPKGNIIQVPAYEVSNAINAGGSLIEEEPQELQPNEL